MDVFATDPLPRGSRIVVAMSGGVDSSVTAALLVDAGYDVVGITLRLYDHGAAIERPGSCCAGQDIDDARRVADHLGIPHYVLDYETRFQEKVIDDFASQYQAGETPIPCVRCNQLIKFEDLLDTARTLGAAALATGHYVMRRHGALGPELHRATDRSRDQSYFLFATTRAQLAFLRFPLGALSKDETRTLARRLQLPVAAKKDSQDICFVPDGNYGRLLARLRPRMHQPGDIVDEQGQVLGRHPGIAHFTVGQRRGLGVAMQHPLYVLRIEPRTSRVIVGPFASLLDSCVRVREVNWLGDSAPPVDRLAVSVKLRSTMPPVEATLSLKTDRTAMVRLAVPQAGIAPGQGCVFYSGDRILGGGWITSPPANHLD